MNLQGVSYSYSDGNEALNNVNMVVNAGEKIAIMVPNCAGKSTLFGLFNGILKPSSGTVTKNSSIR